MPKRDKSNEPYGRVLATRLPESLDRRRKIPTGEHDPIRRAWAEGEAIRAIARRYGVDKRLIQFIVHPERLEAQKRRKKTQKYSQRYYHDKVKGERWNQIQREHRAYKQSIKKKLTQ